ncbi:Olfactory receptor 14J1, partial [Dryobates pubescens]
QRQQMANSSSITHFLLLPFTGTRQLQLLHFWLFLAIYLDALLGNGLIITTIAWDHHLHTPMYFFLHLALLDLGSISTTVPKSMANSLWNTRDISYAGCVAQVFFVFCLLSAEVSLLTIMSYDRYVAICRPLHYETLLGSRVCLHLAAAVWACGALYALLHTANTFSLPLCQGNALEQFFCEIPQILKLSCSTSYLRELFL